MLTTTIDLIKLNILAMIAQILKKFKKSTLIAVQSNNNKRIH